MHCRRLSLNVGYCRIKRLLPENVISTKQSAWRNPLNIEVCFLFGGFLDYARNDMVIFGLMRQRHYTKPKTFM